MAKSPTKAAEAVAEKETPSTDVTVASVNAGAVTDPAASSASSMLDSMSDEFKESMTRDDMAIPFLQILQPQSPQVTKGTTEYIKGAEAGMLFDTVSQDIFSTRDENDKPIPAPFHLVAISYNDSYIEWVPRGKDGGGFVQEYSAAIGAQARTVRNDMNQDIIVTGSPVGKPGNQLVYTHTHYVFAVFEDGRVVPMLTTMSSTQIKPSKTLNAMVTRKALPNGKPAPRFFGRWLITTTMRSNDSGNWYVWNFIDDGNVLDFGEALAARILEQAAAMRRSISAGEVKVEHAVAHEAVSDSDATVDGESDEIPF